MKGNYWAEGEICVARKDIYYNFVHKFEKVSHCGELKDKI
jgi:hypothetical protein